MPTEIFADLILNNLLYKSNSIKQSSLHLITTTFAVTFNLTENYSKTFGLQFEFINSGRLCIYLHQIWTRIYDKGGYEEAEVNSTAALYLFICSTF